MTNSTENTPETTDFPVNWQDPTDEHKLWVFYGDFMPEPLTQIERDVCLETIAASGIKFFLEFQCGNYTLRFFNGYYYESLHDTPSLTPTDIEALKTEKIEPLLKQHMSQGLSHDATFEDWEAAWIGEIKAHLATMEAFQLDQGLPQLLVYFNEARQRYNHIFGRHFLEYFLDVWAIHEFEQLYNDLFSHEDISYHHLVHNYKSHSVRGNQQLRQLSRQILAEPTLRELFQTASPTEVLLQLPQTAAGQDILTKLQGYLDQYGQQSEFWMRMIYPSWCEDPTPVILNLKTYLAHPERTFEVGLAQQQQNYEEAVAAARTQLANYPQPIIDQFETFLANAQKAAYMLDEHTYWIELAPMYYLRRVVLAIGRALQSAGCIANNEDVFYFHVDEIQALLENPTSQDPLISKRKAEFAFFQQLTPPPYIGVFPTAPPPTNLILDMIYAPYLTTGGPTDTPSLLVGCAASPGVVTGPVKILRSMSEVVKLVPGDLIVTKVTTPAWTPFFAHAAGIITESGGMLSHPAIVAREMGIPAVVGVATATTVLHDGQLVELNGTTGEVKILTQATEA